MTGRPRWRLARRPVVGPRQQVQALALALVGAALVSALLLRVANADPVAGFVALYQGSFGSWPVAVESLVKAIPLILTGLGTTVAFRGRVWNIGQEGQLYAGAITAYWAYVTFPSLPRLPLILLILTFAMVGGALWGLVAGIIRVKAHVDEIITTIMLNYIVVYILSLLLSGVWRDPTSYYQQSPTVGASAQFPALIDGTRLHIGFAVGLIAAIAIYVLIEKTPLGYELRALGLNPTAAGFQGIHVARTILVLMLVSGSLAGLAGAGELFGNHYRLKAGISLGFGYMGIIIAMLAGLEPLAIVPAAIFFGGLVNGSYMLQIATGVPAALVSAIQAITLLFLLGGRAAVSYQIRIVRDG